MPRLDRFEVFCIVLGVVVITFILVKWGNKPAITISVGHNGAITLPSSKTQVPNNASADYTGYCGQELADKKQLRDKLASKINFTPRQVSIAYLTKLKQHESEVRKGAEFKTFTISANLDAMKSEHDSDIHLGVSDGQGHHMIVEFIAPQCDSGLSHAQEIAQARSDFFTECGIANSTGFTFLKGKIATITGVAFFDRLHGQFDVAPNGVELHPVIAFKGCE